MMKEKAGFPQRKATGLAVAVALACATFASASLAAPMVLNDGDKIKLTRQSGVTYGTTAGGEFLASSAFVSGDSFLTFCLEYSETISLNTYYYVDVNTKAVKGGGGVAATYAGDTAGVSGSYDPLSNATAWLYTQFSDHTFGTYGISFNYASNGWADSLQKAIWVLENEKPLSYISGDANALALRTAAITNSASWTDTKRVRVLNLYETYNATTNTFSGLHQDQLYIMPVPEPETYAMLLAGLGLMGFVARRRKANRVASQ